jgi:hypothetical protein
MFTETIDKADAALPKAGGIMTGSLEVQTSWRLGTNTNGTGGSASPYSGGLGGGFNSSNNIYSMYVRDRTDTYWNDLWLEAKTISLKSGSGGYNSLIADTSGRVRMPNQPNASVCYSGGDISATIVPLNSSPDTRGGVTIASNRITVQTTGYYVIGYHHLATTTGTQVQVRVNGAGIAGNVTQANPAAAHGNFSMQIVTSLVSGDYVEFFVISGTLHGNASYNRMYLYLLG